MFAPVDTKMSEEWNKEYLKRIDWDVFLSPNLKGKYTYGTDCSLYVSCSADDGHFECVACAHST